MPRAAVFLALCIFCARFRILSAKGGINQNGRHEKDGKEIGRQEHRQNRKPVNEWAGGQLLRQEREPHSQQGADAQHQPQHQPQRQQGGQQQITGPAAAGGHQAARRRCFLPPGMVCYNRTGGTPMLENAFSPDGMIVRQSLATDVPYGRYPSSRNGCGWIATYNLLRAVGRPQTPEPSAPVWPKRCCSAGASARSFTPCSGCFTAQGCASRSPFRAGASCWPFGRAAAACCSTAGSGTGTTSFYARRDGERLLNCSEYESGSARTLDGLFKKVRPWLTAAVIVKEDRP